METTVYESQIGVIKLTSFNNKLLKLDLNPIDKTENSPSDFNNSVIMQLEEYFSCKRKSFDIELDFDSATPFNYSIWKELLKIPYGKHSTYKNVVQNIGKEKAYRAVGTSIGKNPIPIIVPCHRVIKSDGGIGGFSLGLDVKEKLIKIEQMDGLKKSY